MLKLLVLLTIFRSVFTANLLIIGMTVSHSHHYWIEATALGLVDKGHNVTFLSLDPTKIKRDNYTVITLDGVYDLFNYVYSSPSFEPVPFTPLNIPHNVLLYQDLLIDVCEKQLHHPVFHNQLLSYPKDFKFDLILWDHLMGECLYPIIERFGNPPTMGLSPFGLTDIVENIYGSNIYSYVGNVNMPFARADTLWQRVINLMYINYSHYKRNTYYKNKMVEMSKKVFKDWTVQNYEKTENDFNLALVNWNAAVNEPQPLGGNIIPVGGIQINKNGVLAKVVKEIFSKNSLGVIYFSLGSNINSETFALPILQSLVQCFETLPDYQIIWKIKPPSELKLPANVNPIPWAQQTSILAQPKTKLFITHGGGLSIQETTHFGVPIVGIPVFLDQNNNIDKLRIRGGGEIINLKNLLQSEQNESLFCRKVKQVLYTESYTQTMKKLSKKYQDQVMTPLETAVYWVDYLLKHGDAKQLSSMHRNMNVFYSQNLDIYLLIVFLVVSQLFIVYKVGKFIYRICFKISPDVNNLKQKSS